MTKTLILLLFIISIILFLCSMSYSTHSAHSSHSAHSGHSAHSKYPPQQYSYPSLSHERKQELYEMMRIFDQVCREHDIPYFVIGGTLLGSVRHKELIPWDYDIDVGMMKEDLPRLNNIDFSKYGLKSEYLLTGKGKIFYHNRYHSNNPYEGLFIDIFGYQRMGDKIDFLFDGARNAWPNEYFYENELFPLTRNYVFDDMTLPGPSSYRSYCQRAWGDDWHIPIYKK